MVPDFAIFLDELTKRRLLFLETMEEIIALESRLTEVRYQLESMESQLRTMDNQVSYSTVYLSIEEVEHFTPPAEKGTWERISTGFSENVYRVGNGIKEFFIGLIISLPILFVLAVVTGLSPGLTAFVLLSANKFISTTHSLCRQYGALQMQFVSVERVVELVHLEQEPKGTIQPPAWWPSFSGDIVFDNATLH